jgi:hypothetical protein
LFDLKSHEANLNELIGLLKVEGVDQAKASTILQALRENYTEVDTTILNNTKKIEEINTLNEGLRSANMTLLSKLGTSIADLNKPQNQQQQQQQQQQQEVKSLDEIAKELMK